MKNKNSDVAIILGFYNGEKYIYDQIRSIFDQLHKNIHVYVYDDFSSAKFPDTFSKADLKKITYKKRPSNVGFTKNFLKGLYECDKSYDYYAFSDQDDIWQKEKLSNAIAILKQSDKNQPALYCSRTQITDENAAANLGMSPLFTKTPSFSNALVQSIGGGNTMVFNKAARDLIIATTNSDVVSHDWWCYQIISGAGGVVYYDPNPCLKYRQHSKNLVGANNGWMAKKVRIQGMLKGKYRNWNDVNLTALTNNMELLTPENQKCLNNFIIARQSGLFKRILFAKRAGIYRQTLFGNIGLFFGLIINRV